MSRRSPGLGLELLPVHSEIPGVPLGCPRQGGHPVCRSSGHSCSLHPGGSPSPGSEVDGPFLRAPWLPQLQPTGPRVPGRERGRGGGLHLAAGPVVLQVIVGQRRPPGDCVAGLVGRGHWTAFPTQRSYRTFFRKWASSLSRLLLRNWCCRALAIWHWGVF